MRNATGARERAHTHTHTHTQTSTHAPRRAREHTHAHAYARTHAHTRAHTHTRTHTRRHYAHALRARRTRTHTHISQEDITILTESTFQLIRKQQIIRIVINGGLSCLEEYQMLYLRLTNHNCTVCDMDIEEDDQKESEDIYRVWR